ncbi:glycosyltransferase family 2 protein [Patescibacteria group bacterium]|jgi:GT2 family glycosyltransferase|nr:glycosyltransferase family 2 protein [Patescibacteria group bacterium]
MKVAIQVILYHSSKHLAPLLESLKAQTFRDFEIYFQENSLDADEAARCRDLITSSGLPATFSISKTNTGFTAHNELFAQSTAPGVFVLNDDTILDPECLGHLVKTMESDETIASVTPLIFRVPRGTMRAPSVTDELEVDTAGHEYRLLSDIRDIGSGRKWGSVKSELARSGEVFGVAGTAALYRRSAVLAVSPDATLYDPTFFMYKEDVDLDLRLRRGGWKTWRASDAIVFHARSISGKPSLTLSRLAQERSRPPRLRRWTYRNTHHLYTYHWSPAIGAKDLFFGFFFEVMRSLGVFVASPAVWFGGVSDLLHALPAAYRRRKKMEAMGLKHIRFIDLV